MADSQSFEKISNPTVTKLLEVDSELAVQEASLLSQLESVQEKRQSLHTVISLFTKADTPTIEPVEIGQITPRASTSRELEPVGEDLATPLSETLKARATAESGTEAEPVTKSTATIKTTPSLSNRDKTTKFTQKAKIVKKALGWQQYLRAEFNNTSLPEAVYAVLQHRAEQVFEIPAIVNAMFVDEFPNELRSKVRRQVTNILSEGVRKNKWYRGQPGYYSMSRAAVESHLASPGALA